MNRLESTLMEVAGELFWDVVRGQKKRGVVFNTMNVQHAFFVLMELCNLRANAADTDAAVIWRSLPLSMVAPFVLQETLRLCKLPQDVDGVRAVVEKFSRFSVADCTRRNYADGLERLNLLMQAGIDLLEMQQSMGKEYKDNGLRS